MSEYVSFFGWAFLPQLVTPWLQGLYYRLALPSGARPPRRGTPRYTSDHNRIYTLVTLSYLVYTVLDVVYSMRPNYYAVLGVEIDFEARELRSNFKKLQLIYHPDKNPGQQAESMYILLRKAYETLNDPVRRFAYDRFGPDIAKWDHCKTMRDFLWQGWSSFFTAFYAGSGLFLLALNVLGKGQFGRYWRFLAFFAMACFESSMLQHPESAATSLLSRVLPGTTVFEQIAVARQICVAFFVALSQVGPIWWPNEAVDLRSALQNLDTMSGLAAQEAGSLLVAGFEPFQRDTAAQAELCRKIKQHAVDNVLHTDPELRRIYSDVHSRLTSRQKSRPARSL